jgi:hypothetical protein
MDSPNSNTEAHPYGRRRSGRCGTVKKRPVAEMDVWSFIASSKVQILFIRQFLSLNFWEVKKYHPCT